MNVRWTFIGRSLGLAGKTADSLWRIRQAPDGVQRGYTMGLKCRIV